MSVTPPPSPTSPTFSPRRNPFDHLENEDDLLQDFNPKKEPSEGNGQNGENSKDVIDLLSVGFLAHLLPPVERAKTNLDDLTEKQLVVLETFQTENQRYEKADAIQELASKTAQIKTYQEKLLTVRKTMASLHDRSSRLKRRALRLQSEKQKEELAKESAKELEREKERKLVARTDFGASST